MNFLLKACCVWGVAALAILAVEPKLPIKEQESSVGALVPAVSPEEIGKLIEKLTDERHKVRVQASRRLWDIGRPALPLIKEYVDSPDPEQAKRARTLVIKIEMGFTPDTDPKWIKMVARYPRAAGAERAEILIDFYNAKAWQPFLRLYALAKVTVRY